MLSDVARGRPLVDSRDLDRPRHADYDSAESGRGWLGVGVEIRPFGVYARHRVVG
jgi:hypothetical protein